MSAASSTLLVLYYILFPFIWILQSLISLLIVLASPLLHLAHYVLHACWLPFQFLAKFEASSPTTTSSNQLLENKC